MYSDDEEKRGFPIRDFLIRLVLIIIFVLLLMWLLPPRLKGNNVDLSPLTNRIFNANIQAMKEAAIPYFTTERLPKKVGDEAKLTLQEMLDKKLLLPFTDKNGDSCDTKNSYVLVTKEENEYLLKVYLKCNDDEDYILVHIGCYSYCTTENGVCEKEETQKPTTTKPTPTTPSTTQPSGPNCTLEIASGTKGQNNWYVGNVKVRFKSKNTTSSGAKITSYGITTSSTPTYNGNDALTVSKDGTTKVYGYVKDSNGKTAVCTVTVKKDTVDPDCSLAVVSGTKNSAGNYVGTVKVGFASRTDATSGVNAYGMDTSKNPNYNSKADYSVSTIGTTTVYGFVKDKAGHEKVCSTTIKIDKIPDQKPDDPKPSTPSCTLEVTSGKLGNNKWYVSDVVVSFKTKTTTNGAKITNWGFGPNYNYSSANANSYTVSTDGTHLINAYVKDSNGYTATCSITVKRDATKPSCSLSVTSGTKASDGKYTSNVVLGWKSRSDATSGVDVYGIDKTTNYTNNTSYTITTNGKHTVYGYIKDKAGNTNTCSITVEKRAHTYEYQYAKDIPATYSAWSAWKTSEYDCKKAPAFTKNDTYESEDLGSKKEISGYVEKNSKGIYATQLIETGKVVERSCTGWKYYRTTTTTTKTYAIKVAEDWKYVGLVRLTAPPTDTLSTKYEFVGMDWDKCGATCTSTPYTLWKKYTRSVSLLTATDTITDGSNVSVKCTSYENKETVLFSTYNALVGYEKTRTILYKDVCSYRYRNRTITKAAYTDYKWSTYNDQALLDDDYKMTGVKRLVD